MKKNKIILPKGHTWSEVNFDPTHSDFVCNCGAHYSIDLTDNSGGLVDEGNGHDE
jgi:hypothetical protein